MKPSYFVALLALTAGLACAAPSPSPEDAPSPASAAPSPAPSPAVREPVLARIDRLGLDRRALDELLASQTPVGAFEGERRRSLLLEWRAIIDRRQRIAQLDAETAQDLERVAREKQTAKSDAPADQDKRREELAALKADQERDTKALAGIALERDAATQALNVVRAKARGAPSQPPSGQTTSEELASLLAHPFGLPLAQQQTLELEEAARQRNVKAQAEVIELLASKLDGPAAVSAAEVTSREQKQQEAAKEVARDQSQAEATLRRAEKDQKAAEKTRREAAAQAASATSDEERELAAARARVGDREQRAADALKVLGQLKADAGTSSLARSERDVELYRYLLRLSTEPPSVPEVSAKLRELRAQAAALKVREQSYASRLAQVKDEQIQLGTAKAAAERLSKGKGKLAEAAAREGKALEGHRATLDEQAVTLAKILENVRASIDTTANLQAQLERVLGDEGLLVRRKPELAVGPVRGLLDDFGYLLSYPDRAFRPVRDFCVGVWRAFTDDQSGAVTLPMVLSMLVGLGLAIYGHSGLRHLARRVIAQQGPASGAAVSIAAVAVLWVPVLLPSVLGWVLIPSQQRGFEVLLLWVVPWFVSHLVLRLTRKWFLLPQVPEGAKPAERRAGAGWVDLVLPPLPAGDLHALEVTTSARLYRTLLPLAVLSCTLLPAYGTMRAVLYRPELASQVWLLYELAVAGLLFRAVRLRAELVQVRRAAGTTRAASIHVVAMLRAIVLVCLPLVPLIEAFGFGSLARFLVTRAGLTVLIAHVVRLIFEAVLELWQRPTREAEPGPEEEADDRDAHETLGALVGSLLSLLLVTGTAFALFWIWGGTWGAWDATMRLAGARFGLMGFELSLAGFAGAALAIWFARWSAGFTDWFLEARFFPRTDFDSGMRYAVTQTAHYLIFAAGIFFALDAVGVGLEGVKWFAGFAGIGIGFGMQNIIQNFISGLIVLYERPVRVGDVVDVKGVFGIIQKISVRSTLVRQTSNIDVFVPNSVLLSEHVVNWTLRGQRVRLEIPLALKPDADPEHARAVMLAAASEEIAVLKRPAPAVLIEKATESSLQLLLLVWVKTPLRVREIKSNLLFAVLRDLRQAGLAPAHVAESVAQATAEPGETGVEPSKPLEPSNHS